MKDLRSVLATDLGIWPTFKNLHEISDYMVSSPKIKESIANYLILYDQIYIPTGNLQILPVLRIILGDNIFDELIKNKIIVLARYNNWFHYIGNGGGLQPIFKTISPRRFDLFHSYFCPLDECIETVLNTTNPIADTRRKQILNGLLLDNIIPVVNQIDFSEFKNETYLDITESPYLRNFLSCGNFGKNLDNLTGIDKFTLRIFAAYEKNPRENPVISAVLRAAFENFLLKIGSDLKAYEITGDECSLALLKAKGQRVGMPIEGQKAFTKIQTISGVPNIGLAFANNVISAEQLLDLRESKHAENFRKWLNQLEPKESHNEIVKKYTETLQEKSIIDQIPLKTLRFAITTFLGGINPPLGYAASVIDTFLLNKLFPKKSPVLFLNHAKNIIIKSQEKYTKIPESPKVSGRDRNRPFGLACHFQFFHCVEIVGINGFQGAIKTGRGHNRTGQITPLLQPLVKLPDVFKVGHMGATGGFGVFQGHFGEINGHGPRSLLRL